MGLQSKHLILVLNKAPGILPTGGCRKEKTEEEGEWVSESISCPSPPRLSSGGCGSTTYADVLNSEGRTARAAGQH